MKNKLFTCLWAAFLSFAVSFGAVGCLVTAFDMEVSLWLMVLWCGFGALLCSVCYSLPLGLLPISTMALISGFLWQQGTLRISMESLLYRLSRQYHRAYQWGIIKLNYLTADDMELRLWLVLGVLGVLIAMGISWGVCRRKTTVLGLIPAGILLAACFVVTDTVPAIPLLLLVFFGMLLLLMTGSVRRQDEAQGNRLTTVLALPLALAMLLLLAAIPSNRYTGTELPRKMVDAMMKNEKVAAFFGKAAEVGTTGSSVDSSSVNLKNVGVRLESQAEIMQLLTDYSDNIYLRGRALDTYDGVTWQDSGITPTELYWPEKEALTEGGEAMITTRYAHRMLYLPYYVQSMDTGKVARGIENEKKLTQYSFQCAVGKPVENGQTGENYDFSNYLHLSDSVKKWASPLAKEITKGETTVYGKAQAIADYVRSSAKYSTNTYKMPTGSKDFVKWFLEESDTGYCVHYASAATVLLQAAGIPARYVTGYTVLVRASYPVTVRAKDAHAWAEYWLPEYGWAVLEATAAEEEPEIVPPSAGNTDSTEEVPTEPNPTTTPSEEKPKPTPKGDTSYVWLLLVLSGAMGFVLTWRSLRLQLRKKRLQKGNTNQRTLSYWQEVAYLSRLLGQLPRKDLFALAEKAKFSPHTIAEEELAVLIKEVARLQKQLKKKSVFHQLYYTLILVIY